MAERQLEYMRVRELVDATRNPKSHDKPLIAAAVTRFGFIEPIVLDERTGQLVAGHGRRDDLLAKEEAGHARPDGITEDADGAWMAPVVRGWASRDDTEAEAAGIALNRAGELGGWRNDVLAEVLGDMADGGFEGVGFDMTDLDDLRASYAPPDLPSLPAPAPVVPEPAPPRQVQGLHEVILIYQADAHREYLEHLATLRSRWGEDVTGLVVLRALREAAERERQPA